ncbi:MAG: hypothetical protein ABGX16_21560 [Pirellulales bacterium]
MSSVFRVAAAQPAVVGIEKRVPWTRSQITGSPQPPLPYVTERLFSNLKFNHCLDITAPVTGDIRQRHFTTIYIGILIVIFLKLK